MVLIHFVKTIILKKKDILSMLKINRKKVRQFARKQVQYIYTEADLGEGLLDAGVELPYQIILRDRKFQIVKSIADAMDMPLYRNKNVEVPNVAEDFSYAYYRS